MSEQCCPDCDGNGIHWVADGDCFHCKGTGRVLGDAAPAAPAARQADEAEDATMSTEDHDRLEALNRVAWAAKKLRSWDAIDALTLGDMPHAEDAQDDLRRLDDALDDAVRAGAIQPAAQEAPAPPALLAPAREVLLAPAREVLWLAAFGAAVAWQVSRECNRGLNADEAFDPQAGGTLTVAGVADHAHAVANVAIKACMAAVGL